MVRAVKTIPSTGIALSAVQGHVRWMQGLVECTGIDAYGEHGAGWGGSLWVAEAIFCTLYLDMVQARTYMFIEAGELWYANCTQLNGL